MNDIIVIALISFFGTLIGTLGGILASNKTVSFRIEQLERKMDKHNDLVERMYKIEERCKSNTHRVDKLESEVEKL